MPFRREGEYEKERKGGNIAEKRKSRKEIKKQEVIFKGGGVDY
jgi:hypothetical protein